MDVRTPTTTKKRKKKDGGELTPLIPSEETKKRQLRRVKSAITDTVRGYAEANGSSLAEVGLDIVGTEPFSAILAAMESKMQSVRKVRRAIKTVVENELRDAQPSRDAVGHKALAVGTSAAKSDKLMGILRDYEGFRSLGVTLPFNQTASVLKKLRKEAKEFYLPDLTDESCGLDLEKVVPQVLAALVRTGRLTRASEYEAKPVVIGYGADSSYEVKMGDDGMTVALIRIPEAELTVPVALASGKESKDPFRSVLELQNAALVRLQALQSVGDTGLQIEVYSMGDFPVQQFFFSIGGSASARKWSWLRKSDADDLSRSLDATDGLRTGADFEEKGAAVLRVIEAGEPLLEQNEQKEWSEFQNRKFRKAEEREAAREAIEKRQQGRRNTARQKCVQEYDGHQGMALLTAAIGEDGVRYAGDALHISVINPGRMLVRQIVELVKRLGLDKTAIKAFVNRARARKGARDVAEYLKTQLLPDNGTKKASQLLGKHALSLYLCWQGLLSDLVASSEKLASNMHGRRIVAMLRLLGHIFARLSRLLSLHDHIDPAAAIAEAKSLGQLGLKVMNTYDVPVTPIFVLFLIDSPALLEKFYNRHNMAAGRLSSTAIEALIPEVRSRLRDNSNRGATRWRQVLDVFTIMKVMALNDKTLVDVEPDVPISLANPEPLPGNLDALTIPTVPTSLDDDCSVLQLVLYGAQHQKIPPELTKGKKVFSL